MDNCAIATKYNQVNAVTNVAAGPDPRGCHSVDPFQTLVRAFGSYTIPKIDVLVAATLRSQPPVQLGIAGGTIAGGGNSAQWVVPNSAGRGSARSPAGRRDGRRHHDHPDRRQRQPRLRGHPPEHSSTCASPRSCGFGRTRSDIGLDLNNLLNTNYATGYNTTYQYSVGNTAQGGTWANPTSIYTAAVHAHQLHAGVLISR